MLSKNTDSAESAGLSRSRGAAGALASLASTLVAAVVAMAACGEGDDHGVAGVRTSAAPGPTQSAPSTGPKASASTSSAPAVGPLVGSWKGSYLAEKANPTLDPTVKDVVWTGDKGQERTGAGQLEVSVASDGSVVGTIEGSLGPGDLRGESDPKGLRAVVTSTDGEGPSGILIGTLEGKSLAVELRSSDGSGTQVRTARGTLERAR